MEGGRTIFFIYLYLHIYSCLSYLYLCLCLLPMSYLLLLIYNISFYLQSVAPPPEHRGVLCGSPGQEEKVSLGEAGPYSGQSIPIPHSELFSLLRYRNGSHTHLNLYICIYLATLSNYIYM